MKEAGHFHEIFLGDQDILQNIFIRYNRPHSIYNFANLYMWGRLHKYWWMISNERLHLYSDIDDSAIMPLGDGVTSENLLELSDFLESHGRKGNFCFVPPDFVDSHKQLENYFFIKYDKDNADYIYSCQKLFELKGKKLHKKKNLLSQFQRDNPDYICCALSPQYYSECIDLSEKWCEDKSCNIVSYAYETDALRRGFDYFTALNLEGLVILLKNQVIAFSVFNRLNNNTALVHFEKYNREVKGSGQVINWETARVLSEKYSFLNREQDLGIEGLRQAKQSYEPDDWLITCRLIRKR